MTSSCTSAAGVARGARRSFWRPLAAGLAAGVAAVVSVGPATASASRTPPVATVVRTPSGTLEGVAAGDATRFLGVPYATPPVGALRWQAPRPSPGWTGVRPATRSAPPCAQGPALAGASEDCLYLNVTVPHRAGTRGPKPVMVWLHGGGFTEGAGSDYDPTRMAVQGDVIVVTVDFRLGIFGFFGHPGLPGSGTFGLQDQQAALRWVRDNIGAFGGDPRDVTLFGQSGGSVATCAQLTSPRSAGLFQRAIMQSGTCEMNWPAGGMVVGGPAGSFFAPLPGIEQNGRVAAGALGCQRDGDAAELSCLRALPTAALDGQYANFGVAATGNPVLPLDPATALREGRFHRVPVMSGHTSDEHRLIAGILAAAGWWIGADEYPQLLAASFGTDAPAVQSRYPLSRYGNDGALAWSAVFTDRIWACGQIDTANTLSRYVPTYTYEFADEHAQPFADLPAAFPAGASHASELPNLFDIAGRQAIGSDYYTGAQRRLATTMIDYWTRFARTGDPRHGGTPPWPVTRPGRGERPALRLAPGPAGIGPVDAYAEHQCAFWRTIP